MLEDIASLLNIAVQNVIHFVFKCQRSSRDL